MEKVNQTAAKKIESNNKVKFTGTSALTVDIFDLLFCC